MDLGLNALTLIEYDELRRLMARGEIKNLLDWLALQTKAPREEARTWPAATLGQIQAWLDADDLIPDNEQRMIRAWTRDKSKPVPRWFALWHAAGGNLLEAARLERELPRVWWDRYKVIQRGGPEAYEWNAERQEWVSNAGRPSVPGLHANPWEAVNQQVAQEGSRTHDDRRDG